MGDGALGEDRGNHGRTGAAPAARSGHSGDVVGRQFAVAVVAHDERSRDFVAVLVNEQGGCPVIPGLPLVAPPEKRGQRREESRPFSVRMYSNRAGLAW